MTSLVPSPQAVLWLLAAVVAAWGVSIAWRSWRVKGRWQVALLGLLLQPVALLTLGLSARVPDAPNPMDFYTLAGWATLYFGVLVTLVGFRRDPSRGRPRCPKCWYDMRGVSGDAAATCPECGRRMRSARDLYRARPARLFVALGLLVMVCSYPVFVWERIRASPFIGIVPTTVLVGGMPWLPQVLIDGGHKAPHYRASLRGRFETGRETWTRWLIHSRARGIVARSGEDLRQMSPALQFLDEGLDKDLAFSVHRAYTRCLAGDADDRRFAIACERSAYTLPDDVVCGRMDDLVPGLTAGLSDPSRAIVEACAWRLSLCGAGAEPAVPRLIELLEASVPNRRVLWGVALQGVASKSAGARRRVIDLIRGSRDPTIRTAGVIALRGEGVHDESVRAVLLECLEEGDERTSIAAARSLVENGADPEGTAEALMKAYRERHYEEYLYSLSKLGEPGRKHWPQVAEALRHVVPDVRAAAVAVLAQWTREGWNPTRAASVVRELLKSPDKDVVDAARKALTGMRQPEDEPSLTKEGG